jgi:3-hydroxyacyl-[acyl-carrier-protein] dehydratase
MSGFDHLEIAALLPHRYPFRLVDRVLEFEDGVRIVGLKNVSINEPYFQGHFPDLPVMPGVLICESLGQTAALLALRSSEGVGAGRVLVFSGLDRVRFRRPVLPGDQLRLEVELAKRHRPLWKFKGVAVVDGQVAAEGELLLSEADPGKARRRA